MMGYIFAFLIGLLTALGIEAVVIVLLATFEYAKKRKDKGE